MGSCKSVCFVLLPLAASDDEYDYLCKVVLIGSNPEFKSAAQIVVLGDSGVGKSNLLSRSALLLE